MPLFQPSVLKFLKQRTIRQALDLLNDGQIRLALEELRKAKAEVSGDPILMGAVTFYEVNAHRLLAEENLEQGDFEEAEKHARDTVAANPSYADMRNLLGKALMGLARYEEAVEQFAMAIEFNPSFTEAMALQAIAYVKLGRAVEACRLLEKTRNTAHARCLQSEYELAFKALRKKDFDQAAEHIQKAFAFSSSEAVMHLEKGVALCEQALWEDALEEFDLALENSPTFADVHNQMGVAYSELRRFEEALEHFRKALEINPHFVAARLNLGFALSKSGKHLEALEELNLVVSQSTGGKSGVADMISRLKKDAQS